MDLFCQENHSSFNDWKKDVSESDCEFAETLMGKEKTEKNSSLMTQKTWFKCARISTIQWIIDTAILFRFQFGTAFLALIYFDRFCSKQTIEDGKLWTVRLLSVACLSLAAKMEENVAPALSEYEINDYSFKWDVIQRMELLVCNTLEWKLSFSTPFAYIDYFIAKFVEEVKENEFVTRAGELILALVEEINVVEYRSSVIAAAAVLAMYDHQMTNEMLEVKMNAIRSWTLIEKELTTSCYNRMRETRALHFKTPKSVLSLNSFAAGSSSNDNLDDPSVTPAHGTKRKLDYNDDDQDGPLPKIPKP